MTATPKNHLTGLIAIEAALSADYRDVARVCVDESLDYRKTEPLRRVAKARGLELEPLSRAALDELAGADNHGGAVAVCSPRRTLSVEELLDATGRGKPFIVILDGVEDPYNFAHAVRALWAAGATGLIVRQRNWYEAGALIGKASAGATELIPTAAVEDLTDAIAQLKARKLTIIASQPDAESVPMHEAPLDKAIAVMIGGEMRGVQKAALREADQKIYIPYGRDFPLSLGTVAADSAIGFEVVRERDAGA